MESEYDELRQTTRILSPILDPVCFYKVKDKDHIVTYLVLKAIGSSITINAKGVILLFQDGTRWEKPEAEARAKVKTVGTYQYTAHIELSEDDLQLFTKKQISKFGVYLYDISVPEKDAKKYSSYATCIKDM